MSGSQDKPSAGTIGKPAVDRPSSVLDNRTQEAGAWAAGTPQEVSSEAPPAAAPSTARQDRPLRRLGRRRRPRHRRTWLPRPRELREFARTHQLRFSEGNGVELFETGREGLAAMVDAIEAARDHIHLETYILRPDATGVRFLRALEARARAGIEVRVVVDAVGSWMLDEPVVASLRRAGGEVVWFNPVLWPRSRLGLRRRDHRKVLIVDGRIAFTGGLNIGDEYDRGPESGAREWRDAHVRIQGPAVRDLQAVFLESWFRADGPDLPWHTFLDVAPSVGGSVRCAVLADGPIYRRRRTRELLISALGSTTSSARFESPYFSPGWRLLNALTEASQRGADVRLLLAARSDHPMLYRASRSIFPRLLQRGVRIYEFDRSMLHAKVAVFDREWAVLGTSNLDRQSFKHSYEVNLILHGAEIAEQLHHHVERNLALSRRVDGSRLGARRTSERILDWIASLALRLV